MSAHVYHYCHPYASNCYWWTLLDTPRSRTLSKQAGQNRKRGQETGPRVKKGTLKSEEVKSTKSPYMNTHQSGRLSPTSRLIVDSSSVFCASMDRVIVPLRRNRTNENFNKAASRLMRRCDQISRRYNARVYVQMSRQHIYKSTNEASFPMPVDVLVHSRVAPPSTPSPGNYEYERKTYEPFFLASEVSTFGR